MSDRSRSRVALSWWGSIPDGGPTVGDLLALKAAHDEIAREGFNSLVLCDGAFAHHVAPFASIGELIADRYDAFVWICGPLIAGSSRFRDLFNRFEGLPRIAAGVSVLPPNVADHFNNFDVCIARDGLDKTYGDLALAAPAAESGAFEGSQAVSKTRSLALCLRGAQREYGPGSCDDKRVDALCDRIVTATGLDPSRIETRLDRSGAALARMELQFQTAGLVVSSRLHGALLALRYGTPVVAIDQIKGGGKVSEVLSRLGWPWVYRADCADPAEIQDAARALLDGDVTQRIATTRKAAEDEARTALRALTQNLVRSLRLSCG